MSRWPSAATVRWVTRASLHRHQVTLAVFVALLGLASASPACAEDRSGAPAPQISFAEPRDFATGAVPSSAGFNVASGDQLPLQLVHATLSDGVAVGDFNGDGKADAAQTNVIAGSLSVLLGDGRGGFGPPEVHAVGEHPNFVVAGRLDRDEHLDLAVANSGSDNLSILRGDGTGDFLPASFVPVPAPRNVAIGNFDGDDVPDLAVASGAPACPASAPSCSDPASPAGGTAVLTGNGDGTYRPAQLIMHTHSDNDLPISANYAAAGDFDGNGLDDVAVGVGTRRNAGDRQDGRAELTGDDLLIFLNRNQPGQAPFDTGPSQPAIRVGGTPDAIAVADWNADSHPDLAVLGNGSGDITTLLGDSRGRFGVEATNVTVGAIPRSLASGDLNGDSIPDLVTASFGASTVSALQGNGDGTFQPAVDFWSGDAPTGVTVGHFDGDGRLDVLAARLRTDQLSLLRNDSPQRGDGVVITRDIRYGSPTHATDDPYAAHHTLDVYTPPSGTASFAGRGQPYPVVFFAHGGAGISGDKTMVSYLMRSLAADGIVAVSTNYRLGQGLADAQLMDIAQAFRWTRDNVSAKAGGDPENIFVFGHSAGGGAAAKLAIDTRYSDEQNSIRGLVLASAPVAVEDAGRRQPPSLLVNGTDGMEAGLTPASAAYAAAASLHGTDSTHVVVLGRDHLTIVSDMALGADEGRAHVLTFIRDHLRRSGRGPAPGALG